MINEFDNKEDEHKSGTLKGSGDARAGKQKRPYREITNSIATMEKRHIQTNRV